MPFEFICVHHEPDGTFPNGIPNPLLTESHSDTADVVKEKGADFGVAFDGDFDRCAFFDEMGEFVGGEYIVSILARHFLKKSPESAIAYDRRVIWNVEDTINECGGLPVPTKTGHVNFKAALRNSSAVYGGEMSNHHYFRDFACCDSGMIPWLIEL